MVQSVKSELARARFNLIADKLDHVDFFRVHQLSAILTIVYAASVAT